MPSPPFPSLPLLPIQILENFQGLEIPTYATAGSAGLDLRAAIATDLTLGPGERTAIPTGLKLAVPDGYEGQIRARSGVALRYGIGIPNSPGTVDSDYRGEVAVILVNWSDAPYTIHRGDRIAQLVIAPIVQVEIVEVDNLPASIRGTGGFGHTGS